MKRGKKNGIGKPILTSVFLLGLVFISYKNPNVFSGVSNVLNTAMTPFETAGAALSDLLGQGVDFVFGPRDQRARIAELEAENAALREKERQQDLIIARSDFLQKEQELKEKVEHTLIPANVTAMEGGSYPSLVTLNKGTTAGVQVGDMVVTAVTGLDGLIQEGLVGRVSEVGMTWARVNTVYDTENNISFLLNRTGSSGIINERIGADLSGYMMDSEAEVLEGETLVTTGMGQMFAPDILIGTVSQVQTDPETLVKRLTVETRVDFSKLYRVFILSQGGEDNA